LGYPDILASLRRESGYTQAKVAEYISRFSRKPYSYKMVSHWENGTASPPVEQFLLLCEFYGVRDIQATFRGAKDIDITFSDALGAEAASRGAMDAQEAFQDAKDVQATFRGDVKDVQVAFRDAKDIQADYNGVKDVSAAIRDVKVDFRNAKDVPAAIRDVKVDFRSLQNLNELGRSRVEEYIAMLSRNPLFIRPDAARSEVARAEAARAEAARSEVARAEAARSEVARAEAARSEVTHPEVPVAALVRRNTNGSSDVVGGSGAGDTTPAGFIKLYDIPVAAGAGIFLDSDSYEYFEADETVPDGADFAVRVSGDSMKPRFVDGQIIFIKEQKTLEVGEVGIFDLNGDSFVKKLGYGELISLNSLYKPIRIREYDSFYIFGKVIG